MALFNQAVRGGLAGAAAALLAASASCRADDLGGAPVCEASAASALGCSTEGTRACWWIGDNEVRDRLFVYEMTPGSLAPDVTSRRSVSLPGNEISDIEALARMTGGDLLVYASHSRNKRCEIRTNRRVFTRFRSSEGTQLRVVEQVRSQEIDWMALFGDAPSGDLERVARAVRDGEAVAGAGDCRRRFDLEGAVVVPGDSGDAVWVGLRTPVVDGRAVLLRHDVGSGALRFVEARLLDLGGQGIRGLDHAADGRIYGLSAGGGGDEDAGFRLWSFPAERLAGDGPIRVDAVADVPRRSEGVAVHGRTALIVQDGDEGSPACREDSRYRMLPLDRSPVSP